MCEETFQPIWVRWHTAHPTARATHQSCCLLLARCNLELEICGSCYETHSYIYDANRYKTPLFHIWSLALIESMNMSICYMFCCLKVWIECFCVFSHSLCIIFIKARNFETHLWGFTTTTQSIIIKLDIVARIFLSSSACWTFLLCEMWARTTVTKIFKLTQQQQQQIKRHIELRDTNLKYRSVLAP